MKKCLCTQITMRLILRCKISDSMILKIRTGWKKDEVQNRVVIFAKFSFHKAISGFPVMPNGVIHGQCRFTPLTSRVLRLEWGSFEDGPTLAFPFRASVLQNHPVAFRSEVVGQALNLELDSGIKLNYEYVLCIPFFYTLTSGFSCMHMVRWICRMFCFSPSRGSDQNGQFSRENISVIHSLGEWRAGDLSTGNLGGPAKTNDKVRRPSRVCYFFF